MSADGQTQRPGLRAAAAWRTACALVAASWATVATEAAYGLVGGFGMGIATTATVIAGSFAAMLALAPLAALVELPEALGAHWLPDRRWRQGRCPACGYASSGARCPECGAAFTRPVPYAAGWRTLRRFAAVAVPAWVVGLAAGTLFVRADERAFAAEVDRLVAREPDAASHARRRAWPAEFAEFRWRRGGGFSAPPPFESPKVPDAARR